MHGACCALHQGFDGQLMCVTSGFGWSNNVAVGWVVNQSINQSPPAKLPSAPSGLYLLRPPALYVSRPCILRWLCADAHDVTGVPTLSQAGGARSECCVIICVSDRGQSWCPQPGIPVHRRHWGSHFLGGGHRDDGQQPGVECYIALCYVTSITVIHASVLSVAAEVCRGDNMWKGRWHTPYSITIHGSCSTALGFFPKP
jgi:hypothetical protein